MTKVIDLDRYRGPKPTPQTGQEKTAEGLSEVPDEQEPEQEAPKERHWLWFILGALLGFSW